MMLYLLIVVFVFAPSSVQGKHGCKVPIQHYRELGCTPVYENNNACPIYYNCPNMENRSPNKCYYRGRAYNVDEEITEAIKYGNCVGGCVCAKYKTANIMCAVYSCAMPPMSHPNCYIAWEHNTCCPTRAICAPFDNVAKCTVNGTTYLEGQKFTSPTSEKLNCICKEGFKGKYAQPFCVPVKCGIEVHHSDSISKKCAPAFTKGHICPINWQCEDNSEVILTSKKENVPDVKCMYGNKKLNIGDKMTVNSTDEYYSDVKCECVIPPLLTCSQTRIFQHK